MKILICHNFYQNRGGEAQTVLREKALLEKMGHSIILFTKDNREINNYSLVKKSLLLFNNFFSFKTYRELKNIIRKHRPNIAHIHNIFPLISPSIYYVLKKYNIPIVQTLHNYRFLCPNGLFLNNDIEICEKCGKGNFFYAIFGKCYRNSYIKSLALSFSLCVHRWLGTFKNKIDIYISPSSFLKSKMVKGGFSEKKIVVKTHFININELTPNENYGNYAVFMGRISKEKGIFTLIKVFKEISNLKLEIIGDGPFSQKSMDFVKQNKLSNIEFLGFMRTAKRFKILKKAMFLIFPSEWYENFPYVLLESFSLGIPVIASRIGGVSEIIEEGENGLFFQPGGVDEIKEKILILIKNRDLLLSMRFKARGSAEEKYSEEKGYKDLIKIYNQFIHNNNS